MADGQPVEDNKATAVASSLGESLKHDVNGGAHTVETDGPASKRQKLDHQETKQENRQNQPRDRTRGVAPVKTEYLISDEAQAKIVDDDAAEAGIATNNSVNGKPDPRDGGGKKGKNRKKQGGQNQNRNFGNHEDAFRLCNSITYSNEFSPKPCKFGERCNSCHNLRKYLKEGRREDLDTLDGKCPVYEKYGRCTAGWKCRFVKSHSKEVDREDGRKELILLQNLDSMETDEDPDQRPGVVNVVSTDTKWDLARRKVKFEKSEPYIKWLEKDTEIMRQVHNQAKKQDGDGAKIDIREELRAQFVDPPLRPSEKRKIYFGKETPVLAPLTTQGNLPFRRLCVELGAQITYSEMAMGMPLVQGQKGEWALMKAHESEIVPPRFTPEPGAIVKDYDNTKDIKFGAQISGNQPWVVMKATEALTQFLPYLRVVDLNCGCPIDMVYESGAGSGLLDTPSKLEKMVRGMNIVSGEVPVTAKLRTGVRDGKPTADRLIERLAFGGPDTRDRLGAPGCAAITLHGRSRQQRYTKSANWSYIAECTSLIKSYKAKRDEITDTAQEADESTQANTAGGKVYFIGNGDCYSHVDYFKHIDEAKVDTVMIARGAMVKPWLFEEIEKGQYLDKSASERLGYIEKFVRYGLEAWGSDELGLGFTRRFLLEWLSFTHRYVPIGILEHLPPSLNDRPPRYKGRNELETLLASDNYKDWIKISEMFLGPAHPSFKFQPKHKSNSYEIEAEG
ncbi:FMN-linked oxidoreductase [Daldinia caldariorum]|uniref:FMN-linked oxidoreductase n=1 Tax=Daldinia caldariorum TaxID=326644 RepID=UPI0020083DAE|nr:FMN-linked oxidoreductase [Daldinia caldariorum]KAI1465491.1 FMN-linked oxidoreductase [Daldinia caldariorum]